MTKTNPQDFKSRLQRLQQERTSLLKRYRGVIHEDASSESKYVRLKILENQIAHLKEALGEAQNRDGSSTL